MSRKSIADTLKSKRKEAGLSVDKVISILSEEHSIAISKKSLYSYESGHRQPDADTLMALCYIYGIEDILATFGYKKEEPTDANSELSPDESLFISLPPEMRQEVLHYMRYLVEQQDKRSQP